MLQDVVIYFIEATDADEQTMQLGGTFTTEEQAEQWLEHNYRHDDESRISIYRTLYSDN